MPTAASFVISNALDTLYMAGRSQPFLQTFNCTFTEAALKIFSNHVTGMKLHISMANSRYLERNIGGR
jgi:hypothetical protein